MQAAAEEIARHAGIGATMHDQVQGGVAALTNRELEVLELITRGYSNNRIATELFISPKTASVHVSNILAKLHASSRTEAMAVARRTQTRETS